MNKSRLGLILMTFALIVVALVLIFYSIKNIWFNYFNDILIATGVIFIIGLALNFGSVVEFFKTRKGVYSLNSLISIILFLGILVLINYIAFNHNKRYDLTPNKINSLSPKSEKVLKNLKKDIKAIAFFKTANDKLRSMLEKYAETSPHFKYEIRDPDKFPNLAKEYNVKYYNTIVITNGKKNELVDSVDEAKITAAIIKVTSNKFKKVYFLLGHGEKSIKDKQVTGYSEIAKLLKQNNFKVDEFSLLDKQKIPKDCTVLVIAGPKEKLFDKEIKIIEDYYKKGGSVIFLIDPMEKYKGADLLKYWGITPQNLFVVDVNGLFFGGQIGIVLIKDYPKHVITSGMSGKVSIFPLVTPLKVGNNKDFEYQKFLETSPFPGSFGVKDINSYLAEMKLNGGKIRFRKGIDVPGPFAFAYYVKSKNTKKNKGRFIVIGNAGFITNGFLKDNLNSDIFLNAVNFLSQDESLISISPKKPEDVRIYLTASGVKTIFYVSVVLIPLIPFIFGLIVIIRRRRLK